MGWSRIAITKIGITLNVVSRIIVRIDGVRITRRAADAPVARKESRAPTSGGSFSFSARKAPGTLSTPLSAERFSEVARQHWSIENSLHWVLDVTMNEDQSRNRKDHGPENLAMLRRLALNLARLEPSKGSMKGKLKRAGWDDQFLAQLLAQFAKSQMR